VGASSRAYYGGAITLSGAKEGPCCKGITEQISPCRDGRSLVPGTQSDDDDQQSCEADVHRELRILPLTPSSSVGKAAGALPSPDRQHIAANLV
jgi:hypothetical protein